MSDKIFRKVSLERLTSPEQLDKLLKITSSKTWVMIYAIFLFILITLIWSIFGRIPYKVNGSGILMRSGGIVNISHISAGRITEIKVAAGDTVQKGDVIARISQPDLVNQLNEYLQKLNEMENDKTRSTTYSQMDNSLQLSYLSQEERNVDAIIKSDTEQLAFLESKLKTLRDLEKEGGVSKQVVEDVESKYTALKQKISDTKNSIGQIQYKKSQTRQETEKEQLSMDRNVVELKRKISTLEDTINYNSNVISPYSGRVVEVMMNEESLFNPGMTIISIEPSGIGLKNLEAVVFVPFQEGKRIKVGMDVQVCPSIVKKEEYGFIYGRVTYVSNYPATIDGMMRVIGNDNIVKSMSNIGPSIEIHVDLIPSSKTESGFKWSSPKGPQLKLQTGTLCAGSIVVEEQPPIKLVIPTIRAFLGL
jgi:HlyD family secretion protein